MAVVVNDMAKEERVCQLLGQAFNRLMRGPHDDFFTELGVPDQWSKSNHATLLTASTFEEQMNMFKQADSCLKWQWFTDVKNEQSDDELHYNNFSEATGCYVVKIDITAAQSQVAQHDIL